MNEELRAESARLLAFAEMYVCFPPGSTAKHIRALEAERETLERQLAGVQAKIDALMLEYCPEEMTPEQKAEWEKHQQPALCHNCDTALPRGCEGAFAGEEGCKLTAARATGEK